MTPTPPPAKSRIHAFWNRRSWIGKAAIYAGAILWAFTVIGLVASAFPDNASDVVDNAPATVAAANQPATTEAESPSTSGETTTEAPPPPPPIRVDRVIDGDTLDLDNGDTIRLVQIDAPEAKGECYGRKAETVLRGLLSAGTVVRVARDRRLDNVDRYGRLLRYVYRGKKNVNLVLVQRGAASAWFYNGDRGRFAGKFESAAESARAAGRGAWGACEASHDYLSAWTTKAKVAEPPPPAQPANCDPNYKGACLDPNASDYDCAGGSGNGPEYTGLVQVVGDDHYGLDSDGDGIGCE